MNLHILGLFWAILIASNRLSLSRQVYNLGAVFDSPSAEALEMDFKLSQAGGYELRPKIRNRRFCGERAADSDRPGSGDAEQPNEKHP